MDKNLVIILQKDAEGNEYSPLAGADGENNVYQAITVWAGVVRYTALTKDLISAGYTAADVGDGVPCVVFYPVN